ncbi:aspartate/glutamate racemase family protein [Mesorhizobium sp. M1428]|uniref:aspartate/glutamate racemase family protein n=1 Tax=Mesorhizobium sp. M1428 TaxID=2957102 RepID=UPI0033392028
MPDRRGRNHRSGKRRSPNFSVVTTTPGLVLAIHERVAKYGYEALFTGERLTQGDVVGLMDPVRLEASLVRSCEAAISEGAAEAIVIGGGPLAVHEVALRSRFSIPIIEPVPVAVRLAAGRRPGAYQNGRLDGTVSHIAAAKNHIARGGSQGP